MTTPPLPEGPATPDGVAEMPSVSAGPDDPELVQVVDAANAYVRRFLTLGSGGAWSPDHILGTELLAAQMWRRRGSTGIEFSPSGDPVYLQRNHPDIARLLQVGPWAPPRVG